MVGKREKRGAVAQSAVGRADRQGRERALRQHRFLNNCMVEWAEEEGARLEDLI